MATATVYWNFDGSTTTFNPTTIDSALSGGAWVGQTTTGLTVTNSSGGVNPGFGSWTGSYSSVRTMQAYSQNTATTARTNDRYIKCVLTVPAGFQPTELKVYQARGNTNQNGAWFKTSQNNYATEIQWSHSTLGSNNATYILRTVNLSTFPAVSGTTLELRIYPYSASYSSANSTYYDEITLTGTYTPAPTGPVFSMWNGTTEVPCTLEGVYNGTTVVPSTGQEKTT